MSFSDSYEVALRQSTVAEVTSDLNTDAEEQPGSQVLTSSNRKVQPPLRFIEPQDTFVSKRCGESSTTNVSKRCGESSATNARPPVVPHQLSAVRKRGQIYTSMSSF